jgi:hypothetical protein
MAFACVVCGWDGWDGMGWDGRYATAQDVDNTTSGMKEIYRALRDRDVEVDLAIDAQVTDSTRCDYTHTYCASVWSLVSMCVI